MESGKSSIAKPKVHEDESLPVPTHRPPYHVALMREPELVVRYLEGDPPLTDAIGYAGVFVADNDVNQLFADAEPPTHDDWSPESLEDKTAKSCVRVALRRIREYIRDYLDPGTSADNVSEVVALGAFSKQMGSLVPDAEGPGAEVRSGGGSGGSGGGNKRRSTDVRIKEHSLTTIDGQTAVTVRFEIKPGRDVTESVIETVPEVMVIDGRASEKDPPAGGDQPEVLRWVDPTGAVHQSDNGRLTIPAESAGEWEVHVLVPGTAMVRVNVHEIDEER
jgi:hypothetical protein